MSILKTFIIAGTTSAAGIVVGMPSVSTAGVIDRIPHGTSQL